MRPQGNERGKPAKIWICTSELEDSHGAKNIPCFRGQKIAMCYLLDSKSPWASRVGMWPLLSTISPVLLTPHSPNYSLPFVRYCCLPFLWLPILICLSTFPINLSWLFALFFTCSFLAKQRQVTNKTKQPKSMEYMECKGPLSIHLSNHRVSLQIYI